MVLDNWIIKYIARVIKKINKKKAKNLRKLIKFKEYEKSKLVNVIVMTLNKIILLPETNKYKLTLVRIKIKEINLYLFLNFLKNRITKKIIT